MTFGATSLLDLDPELGAGLSSERRSDARAQLRVRVFTRARGEWKAEQLNALGAVNVGLLVVSGVVAREVVIEDTISTELLGPGDLLRPWSGDADAQLLRHRVRWHVLADARMAVLGRSVGASLARFPEINAVLMDRACERAHRLALLQAISHLNSVDRRLLALLWHLAERWGRVTRDGVVVPLALSHRLLAEIVGARRPTVTVGIAALERRGKLQRLEDASWLLLGEPPGAPMNGARRVVPHRRRLLHEHPVAAGHADTG